MISDNQRGWCRGEDWWKRNERPRLVLKTEMQIRKRENETLVRPLVGPFRIRRLDGEMTLQRYKFLPFHPLPSLLSPSNVWERVFPLGYRQDEQSIEARVYKWACERKEKKKEKKNVVPSSPILFPTATHVERTGVTITSMLQLRRIVRDSLCRFLLFEHVGVLRPREKLVDAVQSS